jgi:hypothetical protein
MWMGLAAPLLALRPRSAKACQGLSNLAFALQNVVSQFKIS